MHAPKDSGILRIEGYFDTFDDIESLYRMVYSSRQLNLLIPRNVKGKLPGKIAALIQVIFTWSRMCDGNLITYIDRPEEAREQLFNLCNYQLGLIAIFMSSEKDIFSRNMSFSVKPLALEILNNKISDFANLFASSRHNYGQRGKSIMLPCFDQTICESPAYFYKVNGQTLQAEIQTESHFATLFDRALALISKVERSEISGSEFFNKQYKIPKSIGRLARELVENTEFWAKTLFNNRRRYKLNVRGIIIQFFTADQVQTSGARGPLEQFCDQSKLDTSLEDRTNPKIGFFEFCVFDSGPGLARRISQRDYTEMTRNEEDSYVTNCFSESITSDNSSQSGIRGYGLPNVLKIIGQNGLIKVRSGRAHLYRNFLSHPLNVSELNDEQLKLYQWSKCPEDTHIAEGTSISIVYPFLYR